MQLSSRANGCNTRGEQTYRIGCGADEDDCDRVEDGAQHEGHVDVAEAPPPPPDLPPHIPILIPHQVLAPDVLCAHTSGESAIGHE